MFKELSAKYYQNNKERLQRKVLSMRKKKKRQYGRKQYKNLSENERQRVVEYRKKIS